MANYISSCEYYKVGTSPVPFSSPVSVSVIARIRDTLDHLDTDTGEEKRTGEVPTSDCYHSKYYYIMLLWYFIFTT